MNLETALEKAEDLCQQVSKDQALLISLPASSPLSPPPPRFFSLSLSIQVAIAWTIKAKRKLVEASNCFSVSLCNYTLS